MRTHRSLAIALVLLPAGMALAQEHDHSTHTTPPPAAAPATAIPSDTSAREHGAPAPPQTMLHDMPYREMARMMNMDDGAAWSRIVVDEAGWRGSDHADAAVWDAWGWYGTDYTRLWLKSEGQRVSGDTVDARTELLVDRIVARWWSLQAGLRHDSGEGPSRNWLALGMQGLAPGFLEVETTAYLGEGGRAALRFKTAYELLLTQRLILDPLLEFSLYSKDDMERGIGSGLSSGEIGFRLRYEIRREIAPYLGLFYARDFGRTADFTRDAGGDPEQLQLAAGLRFSF